MKISSVLFLLISVMLFAAIQNIAAVPLELSQQGRLLDSSGEPVSDGNYQITYEIYDSAEGGNLLWSETKNVSISDGFYSVTLGTTTALLPDVFGPSSGTSAGPLRETYLQISLGGEVLSPRQKLVSSPSAGITQRVRGDIRTKDGELIIYNDPDADDDGILMAVDDSETKLSIEYDDGLRTSGRYDKASPLLYEKLVKNVGDTDSSSEQTTLNESGFSRTVFSENTAGRSSSYDKSTPLLYERLVTHKTGSDSSSSETTVDETGSSHTLSSTDGVVFSKRTDKATPFIYQSLRSRSNGSDSSSSETTLDDSGASNTLSFTDGELISKRVDKATPLLYEASCLSVSPAGDTSAVTTTVSQEVCSSVISKADAKRALSGFIDNNKAGIVFRNTDTDDTTISIMSFDTRSSFGISEEGVKISLGADSGSGEISIIKKESGSTPDTTVKLDREGNALLKGTVSVGTPERIATLTVGGDVCATGTIGSCSDARFKQNIDRIDNALGKLQMVQGVSYDWKTDDYPGYEFSEARQIGLIAQDLKDVVPEVVNKNADGYYSIDYGKLTVVLIEAVKDQQKMIDELNLKIEDARAEKQENAEYEARIANLEAMMEILMAERESSENGNENHASKQ
ncbi:MAG: hypothetical protein GF310_11035 [candidate division Zixibacteria bacterium]|nr:hypothetical protein [candidate division Zixibacteria bacterium]